MSGWFDSGPLSYINPWAYGKGVDPGVPHSAKANADATGREWNIKGKAKFVFPVTTHLWQNYSPGKSNVRTAFKVAGFVIASIFTGLFDLIVGVPYRSMSAAGTKVQDGGLALYNRLPNCPFKRKTD